MEVMVNVMTRPIFSQERTPEPTEWEAGGAPEPVWMLPRIEKSVAPTGIRIPDHPAHSLAIILTKLNRSD